MTKFLVDTNPELDMLCDVVSFLRRDRGTATGPGSDLSTFCLLTCLVGTTLTGSDGDPGDWSRRILFRLRVLEGAGVVSTPAVAAAAAGEPAASLAAERVILEDIRTSSILSSSQNPLKWKRMTKVTAVGERCKSTSEVAARGAQIRHRYAE